jgi:RimJ/RimL family protein N-acetyltransferase
MIDAIERLIATSCGQLPRAYEREPARDAEFSGAPLDVPIVDGRRPRGNVIRWAAMTVIAEPIVTPRLRLDPLTAGDADEMVSVYADPRMFEFTGGEPPTLDGLRRRYEALAGGRSPDGTESWLNWIVRIHDGSLAVGVVQATVDDAGRHASIAWEIGVPWQGQGLAAEAASALVEWLIGRDIGPIEATIHPRHNASEAVARRAGLQPTDRTVDGERVWAHSSPHDERHR